MKKTILGLALIASQSVFAYNNYVSCNTSSNGYSFSDRSRDASLARRNALASCQGHSRTSNDECRVNVSCDNDYNVSPMVTCSTSSNGYSFSDVSRDASLTRGMVAKACQAHSRTTNEECSVNVSCNDGSYTRPMVTCSTSSNGYSFSDVSRSAELTSRSAISQCSAHSRTSNAECSVNVSCNDGSIVRPMVKCTTESNGYSFSDQSRSIRVTTDSVIKSCQGHSRTSNEECRANIYCDGSEYEEAIPAPAPVIVDVPERRDDRRDHDRRGQSLRQKQEFFKSNSLAISERLIRVIEILAPYASPVEMQDSLLPLKKQAARLSSRIEGRADFKTVKNTLIHLESLLDQSEGLMDALTDRDGLFHIGKDMMTIRETAKSLLELMNESGADRNELY